MNKKPSALSVLAKMADLDLKEFVFAFPLNTNFKYARTGREGWGEVTIAVTNHIIANIDKFSGSLYMADKDAYADIEKNVRKAVALGAENGWGAQRIANEIMSLQGKMDGWKAMRIARTEVVGASNVGSQAGADDAGIPLDKVWLATPSGIPAASAAPNRE